MKKLFAIFLLVIVTAAIYGYGGQGITLTDHTQIKVLSSFRMLGAVDLRTGEDTTAPVQYRTLNHEGGLDVKVIEVLDRDVQDGEAGVWLYVMLLSPLWTESGDWIERYQKFMVFLPDGVPVFDFES